MKISTRGRYALRMMLDVAIHSKDGPVSFRNVSSRQGISMKYMEQIVPLLVDAGFLK
ncbi:MAG: Rrf2 family transcriptional regulator, partial [Candidatus Methanomethylophilaceae archaeon]|nr:Rrf2 family transcriptional regulator [Candidatus Methanomethylophilaceae archaeon]